MQLDASSATLQALLPSAVSAAVGAARGAGGHQRTVAEHAVLSLLLRHLEVLPTVQRVALFQLLPPMIATMPAAADRVRAFFQLWSAAAAYDWTAGVAPVLRTTPGAPPAAPTPQLQLLLLDRHIKDAISGTSPAAPPGSPVLEGLDPPHPRYRDPVFREELVGCLLHVLLTHPRPAAAADDSVAGASSAITRASVIQAASAAVDWLGSAKVALQGTKPCLGWDRVAGIATTGTTAAVDLWLQLLLRCIQVSQGLKDRLKGVGPPPQAAAAGQNGDAMIDPGAAALAALVHRAGELEGELQGMLLQIAANWRALHPVARPRAVWLCASHLRLRSVLDAAWTSLADALRGLLSTGKGADVGSYYAAVSQGSLRAKGEEDGAGGGSSRHDAAVAAGAGETEEVALLSLERLAGLVVSNHRGQLVGELAPVATMLEKLASMQAEAAGAAQNPAIAERLARVQLLLKPVATAARKKPAEQGKRASKDGGTDESAAGPVVVELIPDPLSGAGGYAAASYPSTLPPFRSLVGTAETVRYRCFLEQLQVAALAKSLAAADAEAGSPDAPQASRREVSAGLPTVNQLASLLEGPSPSASGVQVTGPATPVSLTLSHSIDPGAGTIRLRCCAANLTLQPLAGVEVTLLLGGPVAGANRRPLNYRLAPLPPGDTAVWEVPLLVSGFGWPTVQPAVTLPAAVPLGVPSLRCRPYSISPLQLLAPPATSLSPSEFYQRWQALSNRACVAAAPTDPTPLGIQRLLAAIEAAGLDCVMKAVVPVAGGVHAAFHGASWSGESIAVVVTSVAAAGSGAPSSGPAPPVLHLHFGSEAPEVVAHIRGHEGEMLSQLTAGLAVPAAAPSGGGVAPVVVPGGDADEAPEERARPYSTFSFLRSVTAQMEEKKHEEDGVAAVEAAAREAAAEKETQALATAAVRQWERLRALRVAAT